MSLLGVLGALGDYKFLLKLAPLGTRVLSEPIEPQWNYILAVVRYTRQVITHNVDEPRPARQWSSIV